MRETYFTATVKYDKMQDDGIQKTVTEQYVVNALNVQEANDIIVGEMTPYISGEFDIDGLKRTKLAEVVEGKADDHDTWYMVKVGILTFDEKTGQDKVTPQRVLICHSDMMSAMNAVQTMLNGTMNDWKFLSVTETRILDYFKPKAE